jgi:hypothetical protein
MEIGSTASVTSNPLGMWGSWSGYGSTSDFLFIVGSSKPDRSERCGVGESVSDQYR